MAATRTNGKFMQINYARKKTSIFSGTHCTFSPAVILNLKHTIFALLFSQLEVSSGRGGGGEAEKNRQDLETAAGDIKTVLPAVSHYSRNRRGIFPTFSGGWPGIFPQSHGWQVRARIGRPRQDIILRETRGKGAGEEKADP